jgi:hypothetical protein
MIATSPLDLRELRCMRENRSSLSIRSIHDTIAAQLCAFAAKPCVFIPVRAALLHSLAATNR